MIWLFCLKAFGGVSLVGDWSLSWCCRSGRVILAEETWTISSHWLHLDLQRRDNKHDVRLFHQVRILHWSVTTLVSLSKLLTNNCFSRPRRIKWVPARVEELPEMVSYFKWSNCKGNQESAPAWWATLALDRLYFDWEKCRPLFT